MSCIESLATPGYYGYPIVYDPSDKSQKTAHLAAWLSVKGPLPEGWVLHHRCFNKKCITLNHLAPMTRADHVKVHAMERFECFRGHDWTKPVNVYIRPNGDRQCRTCLREQRRARDAQRRSNMRR